MNIRTEIIYEFCLYKLRKDYIMCQLSSEVINSLMMHNISDHKHKPNYTQLTTVIEPDVSLNDAIL